MAYWKQVHRRGLVCGLAAAMLLIFPSSASAQDESPETRLRELNERVEQAAQAAEAGDAETAARHFADFHEGWEQVEDGVRDASVEAYAAIEAAITQAEAALESGNQPDAVAALEALETANETFIAGRYASGPAAAEGAATYAVQSLMAALDEAQEAVERGDAAAAGRAIESFRALWPNVEGEVKVRSAAAYTALEDNAPRAEALLEQGDLAGALAVIEQMAADLQPLLLVSRYGVFDAAIILLREGLEALLVIAALLAIVKRAGGSGNTGQAWVWGGAATGIAASVAAALLLTLIFQGIASGSNRELVEGATALIAAAMLFYVSYWLHSKSHLGAWQRYLHDKTTAALATGSLFSLGLLAFLAVFREGAETVLFYAGIAPSIAPGDLLLGIGLAALLLTVIGVLMMRLGLRLPLRLFFLASSALIFYLGFKFIGTGIHSLQVAGVIPASPAPFRFSIDLLGLFPTWETLLPQVILLAGAAIVVWLSARAQRRKAARNAMPTS